MVEDTSPWVSGVSACLAGGGADGLCAGLFFSQGRLYSILERQKQHLPPEQRPGFFTAQYNKDSISPWYKTQAGLLSVRHKTFGFPKLRVLWLCCKTTAFTVSTWATLYSPHEAWEARRIWYEYEAHAACGFENTKVFCLWPRNLMSSASIHETVAG